MSECATDGNITKLMTTFNLEFLALPNELKCSKCKSVLKEPCQIPCGCRFCRVCVDDMMACGIQCCSGGSQQCNETLLSKFLPDYSASKSILKLTTKCPMRSCSYESSLADMEIHLRVCPKKSVDCPFRGFGCLQGKLSSDEMSGHLQQEIRCHSEMLCDLVTNINLDIRMLKFGYEANKEEITVLRRDLLLKNEQMIHVENENKLIKEENKSINDQIESIKREKELLSHQVKQLSEKLEREIEKRGQSETGITAITRPIGSNMVTLETDREPVKDDMRSINRDFQSIKGDMDSIKWQLQSIRMPIGFGQVDASYDDWLIDIDIGKKSWGTGSIFGDPKTSDSFTGSVLSYRYQLALANSVFNGALYTCLRILAGSNDSLLEWAFRGTVTITVAHRDKREPCSRQTRQCQIDMPPDDGYSESDKFLFRHSKLREAGLDLGRGVRVSCKIVLNMS